MAQHFQYPQPERYSPLSLDLSLGSPDALSMPGLPRPAEASMAPFSHYPSPSTHGSGNGNVMTSLGAFPGDHSHPGFMQNQGLQPMMSQFMHDHGAPWNPLRMNAESICDDPARRQPAGIPPSQMFSHFGSARSAPPPSEADTVSQSVGGILSDSGYGSMARQSVGIPSVYGGEVDQTAETQSLIAQFQELTQETTSPQESSRKAQGRSQRSTSGKANNISLKCPDCGTVAKTNSELKKHLARHNKPFKCDIEGCSKATEGFSTNNDLERHKRCVHKLRRGDETVYRCNVGSCKDKPKDWPRQDNFKQHLKRKHGLTDVDLAQYTFVLSDTPDIAPPETAEDVGPEMGTVASPDMVPQFQWLGASDKDHVTPASLMKRNPAFGKSHHEVHFQGHPRMEEREFAALRVDTSEHGRYNPPGSALPRADTDRVPSELNMPQASSRGASIPVTLSPIGVDQLSYVPPDFLSQSHMEVEPFNTLNTQVQPEHIARLETGEARDVVRENAQPEREEVASGVLDDMDVDEPVRGPDSPDGLHDSDSEYDEPPGSTTVDAQANLLRDTGAQYSGADEIHTKSSPGVVQLGSEISKPINLDDDGDGEAEVRACLELLRQRGMLGKILKKFGYATSEEPESQDIKPLASTTATRKGNDRRIHCQECHKGFNRPCELKKHQKRHAKPYACTFVNCDKKFGSKNDWKRHENSQHFQLEIWRCAEMMTPDPAAAGPPPPPPPPQQQPQQQQQQQQECGKVCHRAESLKAHLERDHGIHDQSLLDRKLADCRMGRNFESRFWCGFCQKTIEPTGKGGPAYSERFDHIDDHFNGRGMPKADIKDWKYVDTDPLDSPTSPPGRLEKERREDAAAAAAGAGGGSSGGSASNPRKRRNTTSLDENARATSSKKSKRLRSGGGGGKRGDVFWICCGCGYYWTAAVNSQCMNESCNHAHCDACDSFENESTTEKQITLPDQGSMAVGVGGGMT